MPSFICIGLAPAATFLRPSSTIAWASTVAVVGAVAGNVLGLGRRFLEQLRAHVLERVVELDVLGDGHAVVGDGGRAVLLVERDVAALGAERGFDGVRRGRRCRA